MPEFYLVPKKLARKAPLLARLSHRLEGAIFRGFFWLIRRLRLEHALALSGALFALLGRFSDKADKARDNLAIAFPERSEEWREATTREIFRYLGYSAVELLRLEQIWEERDKRLEFVLEPGARALLESRAATVFVTAHVGAWQVAPLITRQFNFTVSAVYAPESSPVMNEIMLDLRRSIAEHLIAAEDGPRPLLRELNAGHSIMVAMDTRPDTGKLLPFFGREALSNTSAAGLALRSGAQVLLARAERLPGGRFRITAYDPVTSPIPDAPVKEQAAAMTELIHAHFESWIREMPEQWVCLKRRWPKAHRL
ncbi:MAG: lysophospholipid acyltransferase family protein [Halioglobus sp.]|nr:lysophospholipid acyltransferase family protein [Halioglobus sp.]